MKIYVVGNNKYANWIKDALLVDNIKEADLVLFTGGTDVDPVIYGHERNSKSYYSSRRDDQDIIIYEQARSLDKAILGICRGSQLLTALQPDGYLIQHVTKHAIGNTHPIEFYDGDLLEITSTHHQMMYPFDIANYELIAWSSPSRSTVYELSEGKTTTTRKEPEIVYYPEVNALAIQGHPEMMSIESPIIKKLNDLIQQKLFKNDKI